MSNFPPISSDYVSYHQRHQCHIVLGVEGRQQLQNLSSRPGVILVVAKSLSTSLLNGSVIRYRDFGTKRSNVIQETLIATGQKELYEEMLTNSCRGDNGVNETIFFYIMSPESVRN